MPHDQNSIRVRQFGGMMPKIHDGRNLPEGSAQLARNVDVSTGNLVPLSVTEPFNAMHSDGVLIPGIPLADIRQVTKPAAPVLSEKFRICIPSEWLTVQRRIYESHITAAGVYDENSIEYDTVTYLRTEYTDTGFIWHGYLSSENHVFLTDTLYTLYGLNYIVIANAGDGFDGGPVTTTYCPQASTAHDPQIPQFEVPLVTAFPEYYPTDADPDTYVYGALRMTDVRGPVIPSSLYFDSTKFGGAASINYRLHDATYIQATFDLNYVQPKRKYFFYAQSMVDQNVVEGELTAAHTGAISTVTLDSAAYGLNADVPDSGDVYLNNGSNGEIVAYTAKAYTAATGTWVLTVSDTLTYSYAENDTAIIIDPSIDGMEGPPSELSDRIQLMPGEAATLTVTRSAGYSTNRIYRTEQSSQDPLLLAETVSDTYYDTVFVGLGDVLPPFGNFPNATLADARARSVIHPNNFGVISDGNVLCLSDYYRLHCYPEEYRISFPTTILANPIAGGSIIVFTEADTATNQPGRVYHVVGSRDQTSVYEITDARAILNVLSLCKVDGSLFYVSKDGLMSVSGGSVSVVSAPFFTKNEWDDQSPLTMKAYVNDGAIYLTAEDYLNWRFDLKEGREAVTQFTQLPTVSGSAEMTWTDKVRPFPQPVRMTCARVLADGYPVSLDIYNGDGVKIGNTAIGNNTIHRLPQMPRSRDIYFRVQSQSHIYGVDLATNAKLLKGG